MDANTIINKPTYSYNLNMGYSASGNILQKELTAGTLIGGISSNISYNNAYDYNGSKPHAVTGIIDGGDPGYDIQWDANGNMISLDNGSKRLKRSMCWDEEMRSIREYLLKSKQYYEQNRLTVVKDEERSFSHYIYNAGGERVWKLTGHIERMSVNGKNFIDQAILNKTLYSSPYMIITEKEYTKHYYAENSRIVSKLGGGMANNLVHPIEEMVKPIDKEADIYIFADILYGNLLNTVCSKEIEIEIEPVFPVIENSIHGNRVEYEQYFYHSDHLGSSAWITDVDGNVNQHLQYMPFGETFVDQRKDHDIRFKFTGKERDAETGMDYFGARYYASDISVWLSVDPLASKFPNISPFAYVNNNPVMYIDKDGRAPWLVTGLIGAAISVTIGAVSASINDEEYSWGDGLQDAAIGFAIGSGAALLAPALGITATSGLGAKVAFGAGYGMTTSMVVNAGNQGYNILSDNQSGWNNESFFISGSVGLFTGSASSVMGYGAQKFMGKIGDKMFKDLSKGQLNKYIRIQTRYLKRQLEATTGAKVKSRQLKRELGKQIELWKGLRTTEIDFIKATTTKATESATSVSVTLGSNKVANKIVK